VHATNNPVCCPTCGRPFPETGLGEASGLTSRQREVLFLIGRGLTNVAIAEELVLARSTVKSHVAGIYRRLGIEHRSQAILVGLGLSMHSQPAKEQAS
jgi:DNA-binding NarL/FixJ family response regulator